LCISTYESYFLSFLIGLTCTYKKKIIITLIKPDLPRLIIIIIDTTYLPIILNYFRIESYPESYNHTDRTDCDAGMLQHPLPYNIFDLKFVYICL